MKKTILATAVLSALSFPAFAGWEVSAGIERFQWKEYDPVDGSQLLKESGPRYVLGLAGSQDKDAGAVLGYRGKFFFGRVNYDGQTWGGTPVATDTIYLGTDHQGRVAMRVPGSGYRVDYFGAIGYRAWVRDLESTDAVIGYTENWSFPYAGVGVSVSEPKGRGWHGEAMLLRPIWVRERVELGDGVTLKPKNRLHLSLEAGYRFGGAWDVSAYYEYRKFGQSDVKPLTIIGFPVTGVLQPKSREDVLGVRLSYSF